MKKQELSTGSIDVEDRILFVRGHKVMVDSDLAELYGVPTKALNQAVQRNLERFPEDFMFQISEVETESLRSQVVTLKTKRGQHRKYSPFVFTEQGVAMLSSVLRSSRAIQVNISIMRTFTKIRSLLLSHEDLIRRLNKLESEYDENFRVVFKAISNLLNTPEKPRKKIGFSAEDSEEAV